jgi:hypothetical protein
MALTVPPLTHFRTQKATLDQLRDKYVLKNVN